MQCHERNFEDLNADEVIRNLCKRLLLFKVFQRVGFEALLVIILLRRNIAFDYKIVARIINTIMLKCYIVLFEFIYVIQVHQNVKYYCLQVCIIIF